MALHVFHALIAAHIATGATGAIAFWVAVGARKGGPLHRAGGRVFTIALLLTAVFAATMASLTLAWPTQTHPHLEAPFTPELIRGIFGWMMLYLAILTFNLIWYGWGVLRHKRNHRALRGPVSIALQGLVVLAAANTAAHGVMLGQPLLLGISTIGFATGATNLAYIFAKSPSAQYRLREHVKGLVGAGISVYTAFFAFGSVRLAPALALNPVMWAVPLTIGLALILYHWSKIGRPMRTTPLPTA